MAEILVTVMVKIECQGFGSRTLNTHSTIVTPFGTHRIGLHGFLNWSFRNKRVHEVTIWDGTRENKEELVFIQNKIVKTEKHPAGTHIQKRPLLGHVQKIRQKKQQQHCSIDSHPENIFIFKINHRMIDDATIAPHPNTAKSTKQMIFLTIVTLLVYYFPRESWDLIWLDTCLTERKIQETAIENAKGGNKIWRVCVMTSLKLFNCKVLPYLSKHLCQT